MNCIHVLDDVIDSSALKECQRSLLEPLTKSTRELWFNLDTKHVYQEFCLSMIHLANSYYNLQDCSGYEFWAHRNSRPPEPRWHIDCDERRKHEDDLMTFPLCSIVYYPYVGKITGGNLRISHNTEVKLHSDKETFNKVRSEHVDGNPLCDIITPKTNRMVIFPPGKFHMVEDFCGERYSFVINPWDSVKYKYPITTS